MSRRRAREKRASTAVLAASSPGRSATQKRIGWPELAVLTALFFYLSARLLALISQYAVNIFFMDQWDFNNATLFEKRSLWEMFRLQHGPHRQGLGALFSYFVEPLFSWNSRSEAFLVGIIIIIAALCALGLKAKLFGAVTYFDVCIPLIFLNPLQHETLFGTVNFAHGPLPLLAVLGYCFAWTVPDLRVRYLLVLALNFAAIYTGFGFFLGIVTPFAIVADYLLELRRVPLGMVYTSAALLLSLASFGSFFIHYVYQTAVDCPPNLFSNPVAYTQFLFLIFANLLGVQGIGLFPLVVGALLVFAMMGALALSVRSLYIQGKTAGSPEWTAAILISYSVIFNLNAAYGRSCTGLVAAQASRYIVYGDLGLLGLYFSVLTLKESQLRRALLLVLTIALFATIPIRQHDEFVMGALGAGKQRWRSCYLRLGNVQQCDALTRFVVFPWPERTHLQQKLEFLKETKQNLYSDLP